MPPQTRSSSSKSAKSTDFTYRSTAAAPKQQLFPHRNHQIKPKSRPNRSTRKDPKQETLTQMNFVSPSMPEEFLQLEDEDEDDDEDAEEPVEVKSKKRSRGNRRKTAGDELVMGEKPKGTKRRKTLGDIPASNPSSSFQTQTLTQMISHKGDKDEEIWKINDSEGDENAVFILETPKKPTPAPPKATVTSPEQQQAEEVRSSVPSLIHSSTPTNRQIRTSVVPSSTSPETPVLQRLFSPEPRNSPLEAKSTNVAAPSPLIRIVHKTPKDQVIPDSFSTAHSSPAVAASTSALKVTPAKKIRFQLPPDDKENYTPGRTQPKSPKPPRSTPARKPLREIIPDSDYDYDSDETKDDSDEDENTLELLKKDNISSTDDPKAPETCYGIIGDETQAELLSSADELMRELNEDDSRESSRSRSATPTPKPKKREPLHATQDASTPTHRLASIVEKTPVSSPQKSIQKTHTQVYTQGLESQRLPMEVIRALGPQTPNSDIMVSLHPKPLEMILNGTKNHEFRTWKIPPSVSRIWIYSTRPSSQLKYLCILGSPKVPGEIQDEIGVGNVEFNQGKSTKFAYEIVQVYELNNPVSLDEMKRKGWVNTAPQKYIWVPPAVVGELTANLKCALFGEEGQGAEIALIPSSPNVSVSQELNAQIQGDVEYSTQRHSSERVHEVIPSSQSSRRSTSKRNQTKSNIEFAKPTGSRLPPGPSVPSVPPIPSSQRAHRSIRPSQATTVSSPTISPEKSLPQPMTISSEPSASSLHSSSPTAYRSARTHSLRSSQFQTRSQMLPDSLINGEIQEPPPIIWDSEDEQSD